MFDNLQTIINARRLIVNNQFRTGVFAFLNVNVAFAGRSVYTLLCRRSIHSFSNGARRGEFMGQFIA
jgi:hypothetical protein